MARHALRRHHGADSLYEALAECPMGIRRYNTSMLVPACPLRLEHPHWPACSGGHGFSRCLHARMRLGKAYACVCESSADPAGKRATTLYVEEAEWRAFSHAAIDARQKLEHYVVDKVRARIAGTTAPPAHPAMGIA